MNNPRRIQRHLVRALAAGALLAAAALPLAIATEAGALTAPTISSIAFTPHGSTANAVGSGSSGTAVITGANFADDGGNVSIVTNAPNNTNSTPASEFTFSNVVETSATSATANYSASAATAPTTPAPAGTYTATLTDDDGTSAALTGAIVVDAAPTASAAAPNVIYEGTGANTVTITGTNFATGATVSYASNVNGTPLTVSVKSVSATSIVLSVTPTDSVNNATATLGAYSGTITNPDGGSVAAPTITITNGIQEVSPSAISIAAGASSDTVTLTGSGFQYGATVAVGNGTFGTDVVTGAPSACGSEVVVNTVTVTSGNSSTVAPTETGATTAVCPVTIWNNGTGLNGNAYTTAGALGLGEASTVAPIITGVTSPTTPVAVGSTTPVTLTGTGFSSFSVVSSTTNDVSYGATTASTGTTITASATVTSGVTAGAANSKVTNTAAASALFSPALTVAGPAITSQSPADIPVGAAYGTTVTLTGTGFTNTTTGTYTASGTFSAIITYVSPTSISLVVTGSPNGADLATPPTITLHQTTSTGVVNSTAFTLVIDAAPLVNSAVTFPTGSPSDVGVGAKATTVYINGSGFQTGATITKFINPAGVADPDVTATVTAVTSTKITATIAVAAGDTNTQVGYTVTNPDGGTYAVSPIAYPIFIGAGPTIASITPTTGAAGATTAFAVAGTGFEAGAVVTLSPANGTCGTSTVSASTTLAVTCTLGTAGVTPTYLVVTNPDGGSATSTTAVLPAAVVVAPFHVSGAHGAAVAGKTVTITISGTGFYGQPKITATGYKFGVTHDSGTLLTVKVTTKAGLSGEHLLTVTLANGKSGKAGFDTKK